MIEYKVAVHLSLNPSAHAFTTPASHNEPLLLFFISLLIDGAFYIKKMLYFIISSLYPPQVKGDVAELHSHFERFTPSNVMGMTQEQSPVYRHLLSVYRRNHPNTTLGSPPTEGGFPGFNSGVVLIDINKLRESQIISESL